MVKIFHLICIIPVNLVNKRFPGWKKPLNMLIKWLAMCYLHFKFEQNMLYNLWNPIRITWLHTCADNLSGSVGSDDIGFILFSKAFTYSLAVFNRRRYRSRWNVLCIAKKSKINKMYILIIMLISYICSNKQRSWYWKLEIGFGDQ